MITMTAEALTNDPCPWAGITVRGLAVQEQTVTLWRTDGRDREAVQGARNVAVVDSFYADDYRAPLNRELTYELEVITGPDAGTDGATATVVVPSDCGYIQDPFDPSTAVPVHGVHGPGKDIYLRSASFTEMQYVAGTSKFPIMGSRFPVSIASQRQAASGVAFAMSTRAEPENVRLRDLVMSSAHLVVRPLPEWGSYLPGVATYEAASVSEMPMDVAYGGTLTRWETTGDIVRPSNASVVVSLFTYQDVAQLFATYADKQTALNGSTYLDDQKSPFGPES